jgi:hypothetical protein
MEKPLSARMLFPFLLSLALKEVTLVGTQKASLFLHI